MQWSFELLMIWFFIRLYFILSRQPQLVWNAIFRCFSMGLRAIYGRMCGLIWDWDESRAARAAAGSKRSSQQQQTFVMITNIANRFNLYSTETLRCCLLSKLQRFLLQCKYTELLCNEHHQGMCPRPRPQPHLTRPAGSATVMMTQLVTPDIITLVILSLVRNVRCEG